jgi:hypothetical protein
MNGGFSSTTKEQCHCYYYYETRGGVSGGRMNDPVLQEWVVEPHSARRYYEPRESTGVPEPHELRVRLLPEYEYILNESRYDRWKEKNRQYEPRDNNNQQDPAEEAV